MVEAQTEKARQAAVLGAGQALWNSQPPNLAGGANVDRRNNTPILERIAKASEIQAQKPTPATIYTTDASLN